MSHTIFLRRTLGVLKPIDVNGELALREYRQNEIVKAEIKRPRNLRHHRKMYALLQFVFPHQDTYPTFKQFEGAVKAAVGLADIIQLPDGSRILMPGSWSFASMDQTDFDLIYKRVEELILTRILPGIDRKDVEDGVLAIMAGYDAEYSRMMNRNEG